VPAGGVGRDGISARRSEVSHYYAIRSQRFREPSLGGSVAATQHSPARHHVIRLAAAVQAVRFYRRNDLEPVSPSSAQLSQEVAAEKLLPRLISGVKSSAKAWCTRCIIPMRTSTGPAICTASARGCREEAGGNVLRAVVSASNGLERRT
jgi:hypothetical protein